MTTSKVNDFFKPKYKNLIHQAATSTDKRALSVFSDNLKKVNNSEIDKMTLKGMDDESIINELAKSTGISKDSEEGKAIYEDFKAMAQSSRERYGKSADNLTSSLIDKNKNSWSLNKTGNIFKSGTKFNDFVNGLYNLIKSTRKDSDDYDYIDSIKNMGADNFFDVLDTNNDGALSESELQKLISNDAITSDSFNSVFNEYLKSRTTAPDITPDTAKETEIETPAVDTAVDTTITENTVFTPTKYNYGQYTDVNQYSTIPDSGNTVESLTEQKKGLILSADYQIDNLNQQINALVKNSNDENAKLNYNNALTNYKTNQEAITNNTVTINAYDLDLHNIERSIAALEGESSKLTTNTSDSTINNKNQLRKSLIEKSIKNLQEKQAEIKKNKTNLETQNNKLKSDSTGLKQQLNEAYSSLYSTLPAEIQSKVTNLKNQIDSLENIKTSSGSAIDSKINSLKTQEIAEAKSAGESTAKIESNTLGDKFVQDALKYDGYKGGKMFSTGDYGWCADFVTYVVKEVAKAQGKSDAEVKEIRKHLGASPQKLVKRNPGHVIQVRDTGISAQELAKQVKPGMAFICKGGGASGRHTGFVQKVNDDGTFISIEGNHGNKVCQVTRNLTDMYQYVDFTYLLA